MGNSKGSKNDGGDMSASARKARLEELQREVGLSLEEPVVGFLLTQSSSSDVFDYLQAYHGDGDLVRRFADGFEKRRLGAPESAEGKKASADKEQKIQKEPSNDSGAAK